MPDQPVTDKEILVHRHVIRDLGSGLILRRSTAAGWRRAITWVHSSSISTSMALTL